MLYLVTKRSSAIGTTKEKVKWNGKKLMPSKALRNQQRQMFPKVRLPFCDLQTKVLLSELHRVMQGSFKNYSQTKPSECRVKTKLVFL